MLTGCLGTICGNERVEMEGQAGCPWCVVEALWPLAVVDVPYAMVGVVSLEPPPGRTLSQSGERVVVETSWNVVGLTGSIHFWGF